MKRVLVSDAQQRKTLAVTRSLGKRGIYMIAAEETRFSPTAYSKYCTKSLVSPNPHKEKKEYYQWLKETLVENACDYFIPMDDDTFTIAMENRAELEKICCMPLPPTESYRLAADKGLSTEMAQKAGLLCPETLQISRLEDIYDLADTLDYPRVIKPRKSSGSRGIRIVNNKEELIEQYLKINDEYPLPLIQEFIDPGDRYDVCLLYDNKGCLKASFVQKEIRNFPVNWGPSTVQESVDYPELVNMSVEMMKNIPWQGVVEIEYMANKKDNKLRFMEINPRFWASVQMAIIAGVDFPWLLFKSMNGEDYEYNPVYKTGLKCRWSLPGDILHFIFNKQRWDMEPPLFSGKKKNVFDDILSYDDPMPAVGFLLAAMRYLLDKNMWKTMIFR